MTVVAFLVLAVIALGLGALYVRTIDRSHRSMERLYGTPDDMKRAGDNQPPPVDGSSGWV